MLISVCIIVVFLLFGAFFSGSEIALISADRLTLARQDRWGLAGARTVRRLLARPEWFFSLCLFGTNLSIVGSTTVATFAIMHYFGEEYRFLALVLSLVILVMGEVVPKAVFQYYADSLAPRLAPILLLFSTLFYPFVWVLAVTSRKLIGKAGMLKRRQPLVTKDQLERIIGKLGVKSDMKPAERKMVRRILHLPEKKVNDVMRPLVEVTALPETATIEDALQSFEECTFSRIPVFKKRITNIIGILHTFDIIYAKDLKAPVSSLMRPAEYIHENQPVDSLLVDMERRNLGMVIAVDEYGGVVGVVTLEDILEEVVGDIQDECEVMERFYSQIGPGKYLVDARIEVERINEDLNLNIPKEEDFETLGGFLIDRFGKIPAAGDKLTHGRLTFTVKEVTRRSVEEVLIEVKDGP